MVVESGTSAVLLLLVHVDGLCESARAKGVVEEDL